MFRRSLHHPQAELFITSKNICYCKVVTVAELHSMKYIIRGNFTELFTLIKQYWLVCMA